LEQDRSLAHRLLRCRTAHPCRAIGGTVCARAGGSRGPGPGGGKSQRAHPRAIDGPRRLRRLPVARRGPRRWPSSCSTSSATRWPAP
jgi:hypothetical protein